MSTGPPSSDGPAHMLFLYFIFAGELYGYPKYIKGQKLSFEDVLQNRWRS